MRYTVDALRRALEGLPGELLVTLDTTCSEGCGIGSTELHSVRVDKSVYDKEPSLFLSDSESEGS